MKASSESGECASLISTGSFSVFVCGPGMGVSVSFSAATATWLPRPGLGPSQRDFPAEERVYRRRTEDSMRVAGACVALDRAISCKREPSILVSGEQLEGAQGREEFVIAKAKGKKPCARRRRRRRRGRQGRVARIFVAILSRRPSRADRGLCPCKTQ